MVTAVLVGTVNCQRSAGARLLQTPFAAVLDRLPFSVCPRVMGVPGGNPDWSESV